NVVETRAADNLISRPPKPYAQQNNGGRRRSDRTGSTPREELSALKHLVLMPESESSSFRTPLIPTFNLATMCKDEMAVPRGKLLYKRRPTDPSNEELAWLPNRLPVQRTRSTHNSNSLYEDRKPRRNSPYTRSVPSSERDHHKLHVPSLYTPQPQDVFFVSNSQQQVNYQRSPLYLCKLEA
ncbi:hypothetical protein Ciccas_006678, partial [Cichlidogyrus casuarinus]